ncbi:MAG: tRNA lysidine(34) synthetase TilS [Nocardioidaceae bacterium]|nr:tRNA lysidine(34) synthetase TilS [Nocardioidaceae bacterium]
MSLDPSVAAVRLAVRRGLADVGDHPVLVACSGGADSLALLAATVFEARGNPWYVVGVTVDHGLQEGSADRADRVVAQMAGLGVDETVAVRVTVESRGQGPEAAAREARYTVLEEVAQRFGSTVVLLGHTLDDQAETVLMGLARGSGGRALAGMRRGFDVFRRPLLDVTRTQTVAACRAEGIAWWSDPHNDDPRFTRSRVRTRVLPVLEEELGPGVTSALARTADLLREDAQALDEIAARTHAALLREDGLDVEALCEQPAAVLGRIVRLAALEAGSPAAELFRVHVAAVADLVHGPSAGKQVQLPGHVTAYVESHRLRFRRTAVTG